MQRYNPDHPSGIENVRVKKAVLKAEYDRGRMDERLHNSQVNGDFIIPSIIRACTLAFALQEIDDRVTSAKHVPVKNQQKFLEISLPKEKATVLMDLLADVADDREFFDDPLDEQTKKLVIERAGGIRRLHKDKDKGEYLFSLALRDGDKITHLIANLTTTKVGRPKGNKPHVQLIYDMALPYIKAGLTHGEAANKVLTDLRNLPADQHKDAAVQLAIERLTHDKANIPHDGNSVGDYLKNLMTRVEKRGIENIYDTDEG